jgi:hypothetical protein
MAITSQVRSPATFGEVIVQHWQAAKLLKPSAIKPIFTTLDKRLVRKSLGRLEPRCEFFGMDDEWLSAVRKECLC